MWKHLGFPLICLASVNYVFSEESAHTPDHVSDILERIARLNINAGHSESMLSESGKIYFRKIDKYWIKINFL